MRVRLADTSDQPQWDAFCAQNRACYSSFYAWQAIMQSRGNVPVFLLAETEGGDVRGALPLCISHGVGAYRAASSPWNNYGGPIISVPEAAPALLIAAEEVFARHRVAWAKIRPDMAHPLAAKTRLALEQAGYRCTVREADESQLRHRFVMPLGEFDTIWQTVISRKVRNQTRLAVKKGVVVEEVDLGTFCEPFCAVQCETWRRLGNIRPTLQDLIGTLEPMQRQTRMYLAKVGTTVVGGAYCFYAGKGAFFKGAVSLDEYASYCVNNLTYARCIEDACKAGMEFLDMGATPPRTQSGHHHRKSQYGARAVPHLDFHRVLRRVPNFIDTVAVHCLGRLAPGLSYENTLARFLGPVGRMIVNLARR